MIICGAERRAMMLMTPEPAGKDMNMGQLGGSNRLMNMREAAEFLGVPHSTLQDRWRMWGIAAYRVGKRVQFRERDLESWLSSNRLDSAA